MCLRVFMLVVTVNVCSSVSASASRVSKIDGRTFEPQQFKGLEPYDIYPRTGRLFDADYIRDMEILNTLDKTNVLRSGPFARLISITRPKREDNNQKKHVYVGTGRLPGVGTKKGSLSLDKDVLSKPVLVKESVNTKLTRTVNRSKRDVAAEKGTISTNDSPLKLKVSSSAEMDKQNTIDSNFKTNANFDLTDVVGGNGGNQSEKEVEEDSSPHVKNNDTDKTLFVHDFAKTLQQIQISNVVDKSPVLGKLESGTMRKTVVDDSMHLYPVYRGVQYHYPLNERRLVYSPKLMVQMDLPVVSEYLTVEDKNSTAEEVQEGRSRRTLKKLVLPLLLALKLKTAILLPLILGLISLISFKGLWSGLTALGIAAALGLKALVVGSGPKVVVQNPLPPPAPHIHHFGPHEYAEYWNRRGDDFNDYRPPNTWT